MASSPNKPAMEPIKMQTTKAVSALVKYVNGKKMLFYQVIPQQIDISTKNRESEKVIISFD